MSKQSQISKEKFEALMNWLSENSEEAGIEYENIRNGLVRFFRFKGCNDSQNLADETINRVASRLAKLDLAQTPKKISIFYGFAQNVYHEYVRSTLNNEVQLIPELSFRLDDENSYDFREDELDCLAKCLKSLKASERSLILEYFSNEKAEKIKLRREIADRLGITPNALHVRVYRLKKCVKKCVKNCLEKKDL